MPHSFDDNSRPVPTVGFKYPDDCPEGGPLDSSAVRAAQRETVARLVALLLEGHPSPERIGRRVMALGLLLRAADAPGTASELARKLGVSPQRGWAIVEEIRTQLAGLQDQD